MPTPLPAGSIIQVVIKTILFEQTCLNVLHYKYEDTVDADDYKAHMNLMWATFIQPAGLMDDFLACLSIDGVVQEVQLQPIYPSRLTPVRKVPDAPSGTNPNPTMPANVAAVITKASDNATRKGRGAFHMPAVPTLAVAEGRLTGDYMLLLNALAEELIQPAVEGLGGNTTAVLWDRELPLAVEKLTDAFGQPTARVMRRRTVGLGI